MEALRAAEQLLRRLTEALPVGVLAVAVDGSVTYRNERLASIVGAPEAGTATEQFDSVVPAERRRLFAALSGALEHGRDSDLEVSVRPRSASLRRCLVSLRALTNDSGAVTGAVLSVSDITKDVDLRNEPDDRARYDPLTRCLNRDSVLAALESRLAVRGLRKWTVVVFVDLNDFKGINERYGHVAGDRVLRHVATRLRDVAREEDLIGRLGPDEFLLVCQTTDHPLRMLSIKERVASALSSPVHVGLEWTVAHASIGLAYAAAGEVGAEELVALADAARNESKRRGDGALVDARHPRQGKVLRR
jgi:diguanylate cyclase (GGDEF)-like protein/PAS domain S-box-containing protein